ncbi:MAG: chloride channel protein [Lachnospiraceae bacterium]|nr:chloride channel protein [Lachnospiraceae bacterium]
MKEHNKQRIKHNIRRMTTSLKWVVFSLLSGLSIGIASALFSKGLTFLTGLRVAHPFLILLLPLGGLFIVFLYRVLNEEGDTGTNLVLRTIQSGEYLPLRMAPAILISTMTTHFFGGSVGREGAALQFGGSIGGALGRLFRFDEKDQHIMIMCGMSAAFSALFGTPMAAAIFSMEVISVGIMHYSALLPCVIASLTARYTASLMGIQKESFFVDSVPSFGPSGLGLTLLLAGICGLISILFCVLLHKSEGLLKRCIPNPWIRIVVGGAAIIGLTLLVGNQTFNGAGIDVIRQSFAGPLPWYTFLLKMLFTVITIASGYKGGEIIPTLFIGAAAGNLFAVIFGLPVGLCSAVGMCALFCGVTNCPITSLLISFELFGFAGMPYFLVAVAISYVVSGYYGLYSSQKIVYSKYKTDFINRRTH